MKLKDLLKEDVSFEGEKQFKILGSQIEKYREFQEKLMDADYRNFKNSEWTESWVGNDLIIKFDISLFSKNNQAAILINLKHIKAKEI